MPFVVFGLFFAALADFLQFCFQPRRAERGERSEPREALEMLFLALSSFPLVSQLSLACPFIPSASDAFFFVVLWVLSGTFFFNGFLAFPYSLLL